MHVYRTGQRLDALRVSESLGGRPEKWRATIRQCVALGILAVDHDGDGALSRTPSGAAVLRGEQQVVLRRWSPAPAPKKQKRRARRSTDPVASRAALVRLVEWRSEEARRRGLPVHVVLHDTALTEIANRLPQTRWGLRWIPGVGPQRAAMYGAQLVDLVRG
jgi:ATP-dependent DNA helicase RecQ